jgi:hypothetical protein
MVKIYESESHRASDCLQILGSYIPEFRPQHPIKNYKADGAIIEGEK